MTVPASDRGTELGLQDASLALSPIASSVLVGPEDVWRRARVADRRGRLEVAQGDRHPALRKEALDLVDPFVAGRDRDQPAVGAAADPALGQVATSQPRPRARAAPWAAGSPSELVVPLAACLLRRARRPGPPPDSTLAPRPGRSFNKRKVLPRRGPAARPAGFAGPQLSRFGIDGCPSGAIVREVARSGVKWGTVPCFGT